MWQDPIVEDTRKRREQLAAKYNHDADSIFDAIRARQGEEGKTVVSFSPRVLRDKPSAA